MKVARERKSSVLASNAVHHRVDSLTGIVALLAILGANLLHEATWLDPVGGLFISLLVIRAGASNTLSALYELADRSIDAEVQDSVAKHAHRALDELAAATGGSISAHEVQLVQVSGVKSGQNYLVDVELAVPGDWTVERVRRIEEAVRERVGKKVRGVRRLRVRFVPKMTAAEQQEVKGLLDEFILGDESPRSSPEPEEVEDHDHRDHDGHDHAKRK
jgi:divalent metal cation (Fe/Co/Zn/Cd) transporter